MPVTAGLSAQTRSELLASLREADIDRYLALLLMPDGVRDDVLALFMFNAEIASVRDRVREPLPGEMRLQWWRDLVSGERSEEAQAHPLGTWLLDVIKRRNIPVEPLVGMCEARIFDVYDDPMPDRASYEGYAGETASSLLQMTAFLLDPMAAANTSTASGHAERRAGRCRTSVVAADFTGQRPGFHSGRPARGNRARPEQFSCRFKPGTSSKCHSGVCRFWTGSSRKGTRSPCRCAARRPACLSPGCAGSSGSGPSREKSG